MKPATLSRSSAERRLAHGDRLYMELRDGHRLWWFEAPLAHVSDETVSSILFGHGASARVMEAGDSLFGLPLNSQTWFPCMGGEH